MYVTSRGLCSGAIPTGSIFSSPVTAMKGFHSHCHEKCSFAEGVILNTSVNRRDDLALKYRQVGSRILPSRLIERLLLPRTQPPVTRAWKRFTVGYVRLSASSVGIGDLITCM